MRGFTVLELIISIFLLGLLLAAVFVVFFQGAKAWRQSDAYSDLQQQGAILLAQLSKEVEQSCLPGLSLESQSIGLLSAVDTSGQFQFTSGGSPAWTGYVLFYRDSENVIRRLDLTAPTQVAPPRPIEETDMGAGLDPFSTYLSGGRSVAKMVGDFTLSIEPNNQGIRAQVTLRKSQPNIPRAAELQVDSTMMFRN
jgi:hypothetical protein